MLTIRNMTLEVSYLGRTWMVFTPLATSELGKAVKEVTENRTPNRRFRVRIETSAGVSYVS